jgi:hypothetical protein
LGLLYALFTVGVVIVAFFATANGIGIPSPTP